MTINAYPLTWPAGWKRTPRERQREAKFARFDQRLTLAGGLDRVLRELERMGVARRDVIVSSDVALRLDGMPRSGQPEPRDHGAAVYWQHRGERRVMAIDLYDKVADNWAAIAATLDAMRAIKRHGGAAILERAFTGFTALPAPSATSRREWWDVLGVDQGASDDDITAAYRRMRSATHPDRGGSAAAFDEVEQAYRRATS